MKLTPEQSKMLDELVVKGYTEKEVDILKVKIKAIFSSLSTDAQLLV